MKVQVTISEITSPVSFSGKYYDVVVKGVMNNPRIQSFDDFDSLLKSSTTPFLEASERGLKNPTLDFHSFAKNHPKSVVFMEFTNEDAHHGPERITILMKKGKVYSVPCPLKNIDIDLR